MIAVARPLQVVPRRYLWPVPRNSTGWNSLHNSRHAPRHQVREHFAEAWELRLPCARPLGYGSACSAISSAAALSTSVPHAGPVRMCPYRWSHLGSRVSRVHFAELLTPTSLGSHVKWQAAGCQRAQSDDSGWRRRTPAMVSARSMRPTCRPAPKAISHCDPPAQVVSGCTVVSCFDRLAAFPCDFFNRTSSGMLAPTNSTAPVRKSPTSKIRPHRPLYLTLSYPNPSLGT